MPEVIVRRRTHRRSGDRAFRLRRWLYRNRSRLALAVAFGAMAALGVGVGAWMLTRVPPPVQEGSPSAPEAALQ